MAYYSKKTDRMDIHIEDSRNTILVKQRWKYTWKTSMEASMWTYSEKKNFHATVDKLIWDNWGKYFYLKSNGNSNFARKHANRKWDVNFDIEWVKHNPHWEVEVTKIPKTYFKRSKVLWRSKKIYLDTEDLRLRVREQNNQTFNQYPVLHEYGHTVGNSIVAKRGMHGDEYKRNSSFVNDRASMMHIGNELRDRHLDYIIEQLNRMMHDTTFSIY